jgi:hypothetical protein
MLRIFGWPANRRLDGTDVGKLIGLVAGGLSYLGINLAMRD